MFRQFADRLTAWLAQEQRDLPWRSGPAGARDPYAVWVSEVMAQQTQLAVVVGYFKRWMARFPTVESLAAADQQDVLKLWEGLGYYSRARNLHSAAQIVAYEFDGELPRTRRELLRLPGIGKYTAGAILSLAFGLPEPVLDGNVKRVFSRLWDIEEAIDARATEQRLWKYAQEMVGASSRPGAVNEGLMELGALLCRPRTPLCPDCPLQANCLAYARGVEKLRPVRSARKETPHFDVAAAVIWEGTPGASRFLIAQRPGDGLLGGLWSFPGGRREPEDVDLPACLKRAISRELGLSITVGGQVTTVQHAFTHFRMTLYVFHARIRSGSPQAVGVVDWRWVTLDEVERYPCPVADRKIVGALRGLTKEAKAFPLVD